MLTNPFTLSESDGYLWLKGNLHSHTTNSDGKPSPQERVDGYAGQGYDFLCLSDHHRITRVDSVEAPDDFVLIQGAELHPANPFGGQTHHFVCLNIEEDMDASSMPPQHVIDAVNDQGGSVWLAHPHWSSVSVLRDVLPLQGFAGIEVFNTTCRCMGRGEAGVHWDDWMEQEARIYPALCNDDAHALESARRDTYQGWTWVRVKERSSAAIHEALVNGASYGSTGPEIRNIEIRQSADGSREGVVDCSPAQRVQAVFDTFGRQYHEHGNPFERAVIPIRPQARWVRFEIIDPEGAKAWSNPMALTPG